MQKKIGDYLVEGNICDQDAIQHALEKQAKLKSEGINKPIGAILSDIVGFTQVDFEQCLKKMHIDVLGQTSIFRGFSQKIIAQTAAVSQQKIFPENSVIFEKGDNADKYFIIVSGSLKVYITSPDGTENVISVISTGDGFGEMALLTGEPRSASVKTLESTSLLILSKARFDELCDRHPEISRSFIKFISRQLSRVSETVSNNADTERAYQRLVSAQTEIPFQPFVGGSKGIKKTLKQMDLAAANIDPVLIFSEEGTMKIALAHYIHKKSKIENGPFLSLDVNSVKMDSVSSNIRESVSDKVQLELAQSISIFGHEEDALPFFNSKRLGLLKVCDKGTVVIQNIDRLTLNVQEQLYGFLTSGNFKTYGGLTRMTSGARVIATTRVPLDTLVKSGNFLENLFNLLNRQVISIPPLQRRKSDLKEIVSQMIEHFNRSSSKNIMGIEPDAYQYIMSYDWPGNMEELRVVLRRAVNLATHDMLIPEDIFIGMAPAQGKHVVNLFNFDMVRTIFTHKLFPHGLQIGTSIFLAGLVLISFLGSQSSDQNISLILTWAVWWPALTISWFAGARIWCSICPMGAANDLLNKYCSLKLKVPKFIREYGNHLGAVGLCLIIWVEAASNMPYSPMATGFLLLSILFLAASSGILFERRLWCRHLCPLGKLAAVFSSCSIVEWRSNSGICNSSCKDHRCYTGMDNQPGCPLYQGAFLLRSNHNCILCGNCVKICENLSPALNLRPPGHELWAVIKPEKIITLFVPVIIGTQLFRSIEHNESFHAPVLAVGNNWAALAILLVLSVFFSFVFVKVSASIAFASLKDKKIKKSDLFNYVLIPLSFGFELAYQFGPLMGRVGHFFAVLGRQIGFDFEFLDFSNNLSAFSWQLLLIVIGCVASYGLLINLFLKRRTDEKEKITWINTLPILFLGLVYMFYFITV